MTATNSSAQVELIPVQRRPHLAKKIPIVSGTPHETNSQEMMERWRGTTPHGREIIRKKLWELKRALNLRGFAEHWPRVESMLGEGLMSAALADQSDATCERIRDHLNHTRQWPAYRDSVGRCAMAVAAMQWEPEFAKRRNTVELLRKIAEAPEFPLPATGRVGKSVFAKQSQFPG